MIIRTEKNQHYTTLANYALNDPNLTLKAKGLWAFIMSKPDNWSINYRGLSTQLKEGKAAILAALKELETYGYLVRGQVRQGGGKFSTAASTLYEKPCADKPCTENRRTDNRRTKVNTDELSTDKDFDTKVSKGVPPLSKINPQVQELFDFWAMCTGRRIQLKVGRNRQACYRLCGSSGMEEVKRLIQSSVSVQGKPYAPEISDFIELEDKLTKLRNYEKRQAPTQAEVVNVAALLYPEKYGKAVA